MTDKFINTEVKVPKDQISEIGDSVTEIISFLDQLKTYTETAVSEHDKAIQTITGAVVAEAKTLNNRVRRLTKLVIGMTILTVGMAVYLCLHR